MGLKERATKFKNLFDKGLRKRAEFLKGNEVSEQEDLNDTVFKKEYNLKTVLEISKEIYNSLEPNELMNVLLLTFIGQTGSRKGAFCLKNNNELELKINKGITEESILKINFDEIDDILDLRGSDEQKNIDLIFPLTGKKSILGFIILSESSLLDIKDQEEVFRPLLSLGGIALENAILYNKMASKFKQLEALYEIGQTLSESPNMQEVLFLSFATLEHGLGINKFLLLLKRNQNEFSVFDGFGCREETHKRLKIKNDDDFYSKISSQEVADLYPERDTFNSLISSEDLDEANTLLFIPLKVYGEINGFLVMINVEEIEELEWQKKLYQLAGSYFSSSIYLVKNKNYNNEKEIDLKNILANIIDDQLSFSSKIGLLMGFGLIEIHDVKALNNYIQNMQVKVIDLFLNYKLVAVAVENEDEIKQFFDQIPKNICNVMNVVNTSNFDNSRDIINALKV